MKVFLCIAIFYAVFYALTIYDSYQKSHMTLEEGIAMNAERNAMEICPGVQARDYCYRPTSGPFMRGTNDCSRIPTVAKPYCPTPGY